MMEPCEIKSCVCICCPLGCSLEVSFNGEGMIEEVTGASCGRGKKYARQEMTKPERMVTAVVFVPGYAEPLSVKTAQPIPKQLLEEVTRVILDSSFEGPIFEGDVLIPNILDTGVALIATKTLA